MSLALAAQTINWRVDTLIEVASKHRLMVMQIWGKTQRAIVWHGASWRDADWVNCNRHLQEELYSRAMSLSCQTLEEIDLIVASLFQAFESTIHSCVPI